MIRDGRGAFGIVVAEQSLRRRALLDERVRLAEATAELQSGQLVHPV